VPVEPQVKPTGSVQIGDTVVVFVVVFIVVVVSRLADWVIVITLADAMIVTML